MTRLMLCRYVVRVFAPDDSTDATLDRVSDEVAELMEGSVKTVLQDLLGDKYTVEVAEGE